jgi:hypothetical protein
MKPTKKIVIFLAIAVIAVPSFGLGAYHYYRPLQIQRQLLGTTIVSMAKWPAVDWSIYYLYGELRWTYKLSSEEETELRRRCHRPEEFKDKRRGAIMGLQHLGICMIAARPLPNGKSASISLIKHDLIVSEGPKPPPDPNCPDCHPFVL